MPLPTSPAEADKLQADRLASLRKRYAAGKKLTPEQLAEIGLTPPPSDEPAELRLEADPEALRHELTWYADSANLDIWDADLAPASRLRRLKAWRTSGRRHQPRADMPPLDDPSQLAGWWGRVIGRRCPAKITALAAPPPVPGALPTLGNKPNTPPPDGVLTLKLADMGAGTLADQLENLRRAATGAQQLYFTAVEQARTDADARLRAYQGLLEILRKTEKDAEEQRIRNGELIEKAALTAELQRVHTVMASSLNTILGDEGLPADTRFRVISRFFAPLREGKFDLAATAPDMPPPPPAELTPAA